MSKIRVNKITNANKNGAPSFPNGLTASGSITSNVTQNNVTGNLTASGNVSVAGTITYEDVTSVDSIGVVTARSGVIIGPTAGVGATIFSDGSINSSGIVTSINVSVASSVTAQTFYGDGSGLINAGQYGVIEAIAGQCDGSTRTCNFGTFTFPSVTSQDVKSSSSYSTIAGSQVTYKPPSGCIGVEYIFNFNAGWNDDSHGIQHYRFYINGSADGLSGNTEVVYARFNQSQQYKEGLCNFRWYFRIKGSGSFDANTGAMPSWTETKTISLQTRVYNTNDVERLYGTHYWDGGGGSIFRQPQIEIRAYGNPST